MHRGRRTRESYGTPKKMAEAMSADLSVKTADGSLYADDTLSESVTGVCKRNA